MSDTPRTDAARPPFIELNGFVSAYFAQDLERELNAANARIKRLEEALGTAISFCDFHGPVGATPDAARLVAKTLRDAKEAKL